MGRKRGGWVSAPAKVGVVGEEKSRPRPAKRMSAARPRRARRRGVLTVSV
jgi:hypothetical protein